MFGEVRPRCRLIKVIRVIRVIKVFNIIMVIRIMRIIYHAADESGTNVEIVCVFLCARAKH